MEQRKACNVREYYAEYMTKPELEAQFEDLDITYGVDKFFHLKKFKYLPLTFDQDINNGAGFVDSKKKQNKLSYCNTC